jgi:CRISP-associated protein Cas1
MTMETREPRIEVESVGVNNSAARALRAPSGNNGAYADRVPKAAEGGITSDVFGSVPSNHCYCRANPVSKLVTERTEEPLKPRMLTGNFAKAIILAVYKRSVRRLDGFIKSDVGQCPMGRPAGCVANHRTCANRLPFARQSLCLREGHARQDRPRGRTPAEFSFKDVLSWLAEQKVSFIRINWKGDIVSVAGASGYSANPFRVRWQLETRENPEQRNEFCRSIITRKIEASIITLEKSIPRSDKWERAMKSAYAALSRLEENPPETISELRALEANCAASYFRSWVSMPIKWRGISRRPIPDNWHSIGVRSSPYHLAGNRNAAHPANAILNYAYAALESEIRIKAISDGFDPTIGIMHEGSDGSSKFIFDLMEPERPKIDRAVLDFVKTNVFDPSDFVIRGDGVCRLNPQMARMVVAKVTT